MISINGRVFSRNNVKIVNGRVISGEIGKHQKFDERKSEECNNIEKITIDSTLDLGQVFRHIFLRIFINYFSIAGE